MTTDSKTEIATKKKHKSSGGGTKKMESLENRVAPLTAGGGIIASHLSAMENSHRGPAPASFESAQSSGAGAGGSPQFTPSAPPVINNTTVVVDFSGAQLGGQANALAEGGKSGVEMSHFGNASSESNANAQQAIVGQGGSQGGGDNMRDLIAAKRGGGGGGAGPFGPGGLFGNTNLGSGTQTLTDSHNTSIDVDIDASKTDNSVHDDHSSKDSGNTTNTTTTTDNSKHLSLTTGDINNNSNNKIASDNQFNLNSNNKIASDNEFNLNSGHKGEFSGKMLPQPTEAPAPAEAAPARLNDAEAKYDFNHDGTLDDAEAARMKAATGMDPGSSEQSSDEQPEKYSYMPKKSS